MDDKKPLVNMLVHLARLALSGRPQDIQLYVRRVSRRLRKQFPEVADDLDGLLRELPTPSAPLRGEMHSAAPVDSDSRLRLVRPEYPVELDIEPIWKPEVRRNLEQIISERLHVDELHREGLDPTRTAIFTGPPGVGKTLAARWIAQKLDKPLVVLDLSAVMSSFLGRTGSNIRHVLEYAKDVNCVLLLDELDAVAKRRDDNLEIGELKRLVTVLLQEIDDWPATGILIGATNHHELLDPAVWRRFDVIVDFGKPSSDEIRMAVDLFLGSGTHDMPLNWSELASVILKDASFADVERDILRLRREAIISARPIRSHCDSFVQERVTALPRPERAEIALQLVRRGYSQRQVHEITGVSRDTIRKALKA